MERQLRICHEKCVNECKFSQKFIDDLIQQGHSFDVNSELELLHIMQNRCQIMLILHHEYRQLCEDKTLQDILQMVDKNVQIAMAFFLAYIDTKDVELQNELLQGNCSQQIHAGTKYQVIIHSKYLLFIRNFIASFHFNNKIKVILDPLLTKTIQNLQSPD